MAHRALGDLRVRRRHEDVARRAVDGAREIQHRVFVLRHFFYFFLVFCFFLGVYIMCFYDPGVNKHDNNKFRCGFV